MAAVNLNEASCWAVEGAAMLRWRPDQADCYSRAVALAQVRWSCSGLVP